MGKISIWEANKNLAIANKSRVSFAHNTSRTPIGYNPVTSKSRLRVTQGHWKRNHWIDHTRLPINRFIWRLILWWSWTVGWRSLKVIRTSTTRKLRCGFLFAFCSNYGRIFSYFGDIHRQIMAWHWNVGYRSLKVIESGTIWKLWYGFLFAFHSNSGHICRHFGDIQCQRMVWPWNWG